MQQLNWFSPLPPQRTDIAHFTARIAEELMARADVTFFTDLDYDPAALPPGAKIQRFDVDGDRAALYRAMLPRVSVFNLGNDARFHRGIAPLARSIPGVLVLHELCLHHFVFEAARFEEPAFASYVAAARQLYGTTGALIASEIVRAQGASIDAHLDEMAFFELFLENALAVVCHSRFAANAVTRVGAPALHLHLPYHAVPLQTMADRWRSPPDLIFYGYIGPNRRLETVLRALALAPGPLPFHLHIYGTLWNEGFVRDLVRELGLSDQVSMHGFVSDAELDQAIGRAHLAFHLRHPTVGESSGGILRSWAHATPTLVTDAGWFSELPDAVAAKVPVADELHSVRRFLEDLLVRPEAYRRLGERSYAYLCAQHSPRQYVDGLLAALEGAPAWAGRLNRKVILARAADRCASLVERGAVLQRARHHARALFDVRPSRQEAL